MVPFRTPFDRLVYGVAQVIQLTKLRCENVMVENSISKSVGLAINVIVYVILCPYMLRSVSNLTFKPRQY